jgi:hypothetical protein
VRCRLHERHEMELPVLESAVRDRLGVYLHLIQKPHDLMPPHLVHNILIGDNLDLAASALLMHELPFERWRSCETLLLSARLQAAHRMQTKKFLKQVVPDIDFDADTPDVSFVTPGVLPLIGRNLVFPVNGRVALDPFVILSILTTHALRAPKPPTPPAHVVASNLFPIRAWARRAWESSQTPLEMARKTPRLGDMPPCVSRMVGMLERPVTNKRDPAYLKYEDRKYMVRALMSFGVHAEEVERLMRRRAEIVYEGQPAKLKTRSSRADMWIDAYLKRPSTLQLTCADVKRRTGWCPEGEACSRQAVGDIENLVA